METALAPADTSLFVALEHVWRPLRLRGRSASPVCRGAVVDVKDLGRAAVEIDVIDHAVGAPPRAQATCERSGQWRARPERVLGQRAVEEFQYGSRYCLRQPFGQGTPRRRCSRAAVIHALRITGVWLCLPNDVTYILTRCPRFELQVMIPICFIQNSNRCGTTCTSRHTENEHVTSLAIAEVPPLQLKAGAGKGLISGGARRQTGASRGDAMRANDVGSALARRGARSCVTVGPGASPKFWEVLVCEQRSPHQIERLTHGEIETQTDRAL